MEQRQGISRFYQKRNCSFIKDNNITVEALRNLRTEIYTTHIFIRKQNHSISDDALNYIHRAALDQWRTDVHNTFLDGHISVEDRKLLLSV